MKSIETVTFIYQKTKVDNYETLGKIARLPNSAYPKGCVSCSKDNFVVNQTLVFQIKFCAKILALQVAAKR